MRSHIELYKIMGGDALSSSAFISIIKGILFSYSIYALILGKQEYLLLSISILSLFVLSLVVILLGFNKKNGIPFNKDLLIKKRMNGKEFLHFMSFSLLFFLGAGLLNLIALNIIDYIYGAINYSIMEYIIYKVNSLTTMIMFLLAVSVIPLHALLSIIFILYTPYKYIKYLRFKLDKSN